MLSFSEILIPQKDLSFGAVTTCLTFTAFLQNGTRVGAHEGQQARVGGDWDKFKGFLAEGTVDRIEVKGVTDQWYVKFDVDTFEVVGGKDNLKSISDFGSPKKANKALFYTNHKAIKDWTKSTFGVGTVNVTDSAAGEIRWPA